MGKNDINRRDFIRKSTFSAGLVMGAPLVARSQTPGSKPDELRVAFIGCGRAHEILFDAMRNIPNLRYVAACDLLSWRRRRTAGLTRHLYDYVPNRYTDAEEMLSKEKDLDTVSKYGYLNHHEFLNWRQYRKFSTGLISRLMCHQLDVANWFLKEAATNVHAVGHKHPFPEREQFSSIMATTRFPSCSGALQSGFTGISEHGYHEAFKGVHGILRMSERDIYTALIRHCDAPSWYSLAKRGYVVKRDGNLQPPDPYRSDCSREYDPYFDLPGTNDRPPHYYHLDNFFSAIRGKATLNHDAAQAFQSELALYAMDQCVHETSQTHVPSLET